MQELLRQIAALEDRIERLERVERVLSVAPTAWTPTLRGSGTAGTFTYTVQDGRYVRLGQFVAAFGRLVISAIGVSPTSNLQIGALPVAARSGLGSLYAGYLLVGNIGNYNWSAGTQVGGVIGTGATVVDLIQSQDNGVSVLMPVSAITTAVLPNDLTFAAIYLV